MKKIYLFILALAALCAVSMPAKAQNVQLHYDFGHTSNTFAQRPKLTTTVEMFRPDKWGNTFFFVDMNYQNSGVESAYWEIAREFRFWKAPVYIHIEYDGGTSNQFSFNDAYLLGATYAYNAADFSYGFTITPMYKYLAKQDRRHSAQLTATWYWNMANRIFTFTGLADLWGDRDALGKNKCVFLSEPQFWFNLNKVKGIDPALNLSVGTEVELSYNFAGVKNTFYAIPTLAVKWTF